nr:MAG TPA: hypothetical protein [Caudoviricetes sp.]
MIIFGHPSVLVASDDPEKILSERRLISGWMYKKLFFRSIRPE